jgi:hypothetical protein
MLPTSASAPVALARPLRTGDATLYRGSINKASAQGCRNWPAEFPQPEVSVQYESLNRATDERRVGTGRRDDPYRYRLPNEDDKYRDRGEMSPLGDLPELFYR